jgi:hypothetical protein
MSDLDKGRDLDEEFARKIHEEARRNPNSPYANKYVGIAKGQVVVAADDMDEFMLRLQQIGPDSGECLCVWIDAEGEFNEANEIWELR